ncbi:MAG: hypothetical protein HQ521_13655 [Bacteroidetes bacterium]|nr:hypothetical protein [Bacteroidota bacterium]
MKGISHFLLVSFFFISSCTSLFAIDENSDTLVVIKSITLEGNKITKDRIILREIEFEVGSILKVSTLDSLIIKSQQNLMNRSLFNFATITKSIESNECNVNVKVIERWYIWPIPILQFADRNINAWLDKKDFGRINYGIDLNIENFRGLMENFSIILQIGYDVKLGFKWKTPYLTKNQIFGIGIDGSVKLNHEVAFKTVNNEELFYNSPSGYAQRNITTSIDLTFRLKYNYLHGFSIRFNQFIFQDTIFKLNPDFASSVQEFNYFTIDYGFKLNFRDYNPYPLAGFYFDVSVSKKGFGVFGDEVNNISLNAKFDHYFNIYRRWYFAYNLSAQIANENQRLPYFIKSGLGYHPNDIRGYELFVVDGQQIGIVKSNLKFELLPRTTFKIKWIKSTKFSDAFIAMYLNIFFDLAYVSDIYANGINPLANQFLYGTGIGLDIISYYDVVLRLEGSVNKQNKTGFFISFVAPI